MKKILFSAIAIAAMAVSCQVEKLDEGVAPGGQTVKITAELPDTKTVFNPDKTVAWEENDELTVVVNSNSAYKFTKETGSNTFTASGVSLAEGTNTYHVLYPYNEHVTKVDAGVTDRYINIPGTAAAVQNGVNSTSHIKGVMYGYATADGSASPSVQMHQLTALLKIDVTNNHTEPIEVKSISVSTDAADQLLSGTFYINLENGTTESSGPNFTFNSTSLEVSGATLEAGATGTFWVSAHPFSVPQGSHLTVNVDTDKGYVIDERTYEKDLNFAAGTVNTSTFDFKNPVVELEKLTVAEFKAKAVGDVYYELTGTVTDLYNTTYGNFTLVDATGSVSVYGLTATKQASNDKSFGSLGIKEGDIVTLASKRGEHNGEAQAGGQSYPAYYISHEATPYCNVTPSTVNVAADATSATFKVDANVEWTIASDNPDFKVSPASGSEAAEITVTFPANETSETVTAVLTVSSELGEKTVTISQASATASTVELLREDFTGLSGNNTGTSGSSTQWNGNDNFPTVNAAYQAGDAVKIGSSKKVGSIESSVLAVPAGATLTVDFDVKGWTSVEGNIDVTFNGETKTVEYTAEMGGSFESKSVSFVVASETSSTVKFATTAKRAFLDNIVISYTK